jgi:hypothetical protein
MRVTVGALRKVCLADHHVKGVLMKFPTRSVSLVAAVLSSLFATSNSLASVNNLEPVTQAISLANTTQPLRVAYENQTNPIAVCNLASYCEYSILVDLNPDPIIGGSHTDNPGFTHSLQQRQPAALRQAVNCCPGPTTVDFVAQIKE